MINVFQLSWYAMEKRLDRTRQDDIEIIASIKVLVLWKEMDRPRNSSINWNCRDVGDSLNHWR